MKQKKKLVIVSEENDGESSTSEIIHLCRGEDICCVITIFFSGFSRNFVLGIINLSLSGGNRGGNYMIFSCVNIFFKKKKSFATV